MPDIAHITQKQLDLERQFEDLKKHVTNEHEKTKEKIKDMENRLTGMENRLTGRLDKIFELLLDHKSKS